MQQKGPYSFLSYDLIICFVEEETEKRIIFGLISCLSFIHKKLRKGSSKLLFPISQLTENIDFLFFNILWGHPRAAKRAQKICVSIVSTGVINIFVICLHLPTLLNKSWDFLSFLVLAIIYITFHGHIQNLGFLNEKTKILQPFWKSKQTASKWAQNCQWLFLTQGSIWEGT